MLPTVRLTLTSSRGFGLRAARTFTTSHARHAKNQLFASVRHPTDLHTYQQLAASARAPLLTLWTASWCGACGAAEPLLRSLVGAGVGEPEGGVAFCSVQLDAPDIMSGGGGDSAAAAGGLGMMYMVTSVPTLLSFDAAGPVAASKVVDARRLGDRAFLEEWIRSEARRSSGGGGGGGGGVLGGLFAGWR
ncbi:putative thioredoxin-like protein [Rosellinia necatrix]|uniref:Putative thioredoxin-like protein n=1 Tax=Rosellinia necatrix TaxID=77044 RepID=A0A1S8AAB6_ROSNE|nr:putative thioredoxin-like protein [Rosellinia necatrix]